VVLNHKIERNDANFVLLHDRAIRWQPAAASTGPASLAASLTESPAQPAVTEVMPDTGDPAIATVPPTEAVIPTTQSPPTEAPPTQAASSGGTVVYKIVPGESQLMYEVGEVFINDNNRFNLASGVTPRSQARSLSIFQRPQIAR
jgi:hypothetical protein